MTSPLRKSHQTTAPAKTAKSRKLLARLIQGTAALLLAVGTTATVQAQEARLQHQPQVAQQQLKWRPARPAMAAQPGTPGKIQPSHAVRQVQYAEANDGPQIAPAQLLLNTSSSGPAMSPLPKPTAQRVAQAPNLFPDVTVPSAPATPMPMTPSTPMSTDPLPPPPMVPSLNTPPSLPALETPPTTPSVEIPLPPPTTPTPMPMTEPMAPSPLPNVTPTPEPIPPSTPAPRTPPTTSGNNSDKPQTVQDCETAKNKASNVRLSAGLGMQILNLGTTKANNKVPYECTVTGHDFSARSWGCLTYTWKASALCHKPLYFEQVSMERYGHSWGPVLDPVVSAAHFFGTVPILPYKMGVDTPCECEYALGYYRPGNCAPYMIEPFPVSGRGALMQAGAVVGGAAVIP